MGTAFNALKRIGVIHTDVKIDNIMMTAPGYTLVSALPSKKGKNKLRKSKKDMEKIN